MARKKKQKYVPVDYRDEDILNHLKYDTVYRFDKYTRPDFRHYEYIHQQTVVTWNADGSVTIKNLELTEGEKLFNAAPECVRKRVWIEYNEWFRWFV